MIVPDENGEIVSRYLGQAVNEERLSGTGAGSFRIEDERLAERWLEADTPARSSTSVPCSRSPRRVRNDH